MTKKILFVLTVAACFFFYGCDGQTSDTDRAASIISKHNIRFLEPPRRIPSRVSVDAPLLGNGYMGVALAGQPERQVFYVARNDFWRLKSAHGKAYPAMLGRVEVLIPGLTGGDVCRVTVFSEKGKTLNLLNPWPEREVLVKSEGGERIFRGDTLRIATEAGVKYSLAPVKSSSGK
jgi:hypothetical protein